MTWRQNKILILTGGGCIFTILVLLFLRARNPIRVGTGDEASQVEAKLGSENEKNPTGTSTKLTKEDYEIVAEVIATSEYSIFDKRKMPLSDIALEKTLQELIQAHNFFINLNKIERLLGDKKCAALPQELSEKVVLLTENINSGQYKTPDEVLSEKYRLLFHETVLSDKKEISLAQYYAMEDDPVFRMEVSDWHKFKFYVSAFYKEFDRLERQMLEDKVEWELLKIDEMQLNLIYSKELTGDTSYGI